MESILATAILEMGRMSGGKSFCPSDVVKWIFPVDWKYFIADVEEAMMQLYREGRISVRQGDLEIPKDRMPRGPVRITLLTQTKSF